jgi:hypothetical protein
MRERRSSKLDSHLGSAGEQPSGAEGKRALASLIK